MDQDRINSASRDLIDAVRDIFVTEAAKDAGNAPQLNRALDLMAQLQPDPNHPEPTKVPGCRHLSRALDIGEVGPAATVAAAIGILEPTLAWAQTPRYNVENKGAKFMDNYGWSGLGLTGSEDMSFGILLLGPGVIYPPTSYESEGIFLVIAGSPEWKSGDGPWVRAEDGSVVCRPWNRAEGKRCGTEPMLALYAWMYK